MTTIAYKDRIIAYDSRYVCGDTIEDDAGEKCYIKNGAVFFMSGNLCDYELLIDSYFADKAIKTAINARALVYDKDILYSTAVSEDGFWKCKERLDIHIAIGSGKSFALAFMDTGMSAEDAVKATCNRDIYTGGIIRTFKIDR